MGVGKALVTGGLGFIGSNLAIRLVNDGWDVTVVDNRLPGCGANLHNLAPIAGRVRLIDCDIGDTYAFADELRSADVVFNLAGELSHIHSMEFPERDLLKNTQPHLRFLLACREVAPHVRIVFAGTRQVYGVPAYLPADEALDAQPVDFNGIHKFAAAQYHLLLARLGELDCVVLRLTNVYGPRMALSIPCQGFMGTFLRRVLMGQYIDIFGDGKQLRDPLHVDDAVEAFLLAGTVERLPNALYNVGGREVLSLRTIGETIVAEGLGPGLRFRPFPAERKAIDIGSYYTDTSRIQADLGWQPRKAFVDGVAESLRFYRQELRHYVDPLRQAECPMPEHALGRQSIFASTRCGAD